MTRFYPKEFLRLNGRCKLKRRVYKQKEASRQTIAAWRDANCNEISPLRSEGKLQTVLDLAPSVLARSGRESEIAARTVSGVDNGCRAHGLRTRPGGIK